MRRGASGLVLYASMTLSSKAVRASSQLSELLYPNDEEFRFCQLCGYSRPRSLPPPPPPLKAPIDLPRIEVRWEALLRRKQPTPYCRQKSSLGTELASFLQNLSPPRDLQSATPMDVVSFLIWKDAGGKTKVHWTHARFGTKSSFRCACPIRLAFDTFD